MNILKMFKQKSTPIGILDGGVEGINIFNSLVKNYPNQSFIYVNDFKNYPYEGLKEEDILEYVKSSIEILLSYQVSKIIVVNNSIIEYCDEYLKSLEIPVVRITDILIDYLNTNYEHKNILFLGKQYIIKANLYQKNIKYNHMYNLPSDDLESLILNKKVKTAKSFEKTKELLANVHNRDYNILCYSDSYLDNLRIEFNEYKTNNLGNVVSKSLVNEINNSTRNSGNFIVSYLEKSEFLDKVYWIDCKYKYKKIGE